MDVQRRVMSWMFDLGPVGNLPSPQLISRLVEIAAAASLADGERTLEEETLAKSVLRRLPAFEAFDDMTISMFLAGAFLKAQTTPQGDLLKAIGQGLTSDDERLMLYAVALRIILADREISAPERAFLDQLCNALQVNPVDAMTLRNAMAEIVGALVGQDDNTPLRSPSEAFDAHWKSAEEAMAQDEKLLAEKEFSSAFAEACRIGSGDPAWAKALHKLVALRIELQRYAEGEDLFKKAVQLQERELGDKDPRLADTLNRFGVYLHYPKRKDDAKAYYERAIAILQGAGEEHRATLAQVEWNLGRLYKMSDQKQEAEQHFQKALALYEALQNGRSAIGVISDLIEMHRWSNDKLADLKMLFPKKLAAIATEEGKGSKAYQDTLASFAECLYYKQQYQDAYDRYQEWLALFEERQDKKAIDAVQILRNVSYILSSLQRNDERITLLERIAKTIEEAHGSESKELAEALNDWASALWGRSNTTGAIPLFERALAIREKVFAPGASEIQWLISSLSSCYQSAGRKEDSVALTKRSVEGLLLAGVENAELVNALSSLANNLYNANKPEEGFAQYQKALEVAERVHGAESVEVARICDSFASRCAYSNPARKDDSVRLHLRSIAIYDKTNPQYADNSRNSLVSIYFYDNKFAEALPIYSKLMPYFENLYGKDSINLAYTLPNIAVCYEKTDDLENAENIRQQVVDLYVKHKGATSAELRYPLLALINIQKKRERWAEAGASADKMIEISKTQQGAESAEAANDTNDAALVYLSGGKREEALSRFQEAHRLWSKSLGAEHPNTPLALYNSAYTLKEMGRNLEALAAFSSVLRVREKILGTSHANTAYTQYHLGDIMVLEKQYAEAEPVLRACLATQEQSFGAYNVNTKNTRAILVKALRGLGRDDEANVLEGAQNLPS